MQDARIERVINNMLDKFMYFPGKEVLGKKKKKEKKGKVEK
jgi:hypothetical protein